MAEVATHWTTASPSSSTRVPPAMNPSFAATRADARFAGAIHTAADRRPFEAARAHDDVLGLERHQERTAPLLGASCRNQTQRTGGYMFRRKRLVLHDDPARREGPGRKRFEFGQRYGQQHEGQVDQAFTWYAERAAPRHRRLTAANRRPG